MSLKQDSPDGHCALVVHAVPQLLFAADQVLPQRIEEALDLDDELLPPPLLEEDPPPVHGSAFRSLKQDSPEHCALVVHLVPHFPFASLQSLPQRTVHDPPPPPLLLEEDPLAPHGASDRSLKQVSPDLQSSLLAHAVPHLLFAVAQSLPQRTLDAA